MESDQRILGYDISIWRDDRGCGGAYFQIRRNGVLLYSTHQLCDAALAIGALEPDDPDARFIVPGHDLTGDGQPDLVMTGYSGGVNCCVTYYLFEIGKRFRPIDRITLYDDDHASPHFVRLATGPGVQIVLHDWTFADWHSDFAESPAPLVILTYRDGRYRLAEDLMRERPPSDEWLKSKADRVRLDATAANFQNPFPAWPTAKIPPEMWETMLTLIYEGHESLAWKFVDLAWPAKIWGKRQFVAEFKARLATSRYWPELKKMQTTSAAKAAAPAAAPSPAPSPASSWPAPPPVSSK